MRFIVRNLIFRSLFVTLLMISSSSNAELFGRLEITPGSGNYLAYYDDQLNITWLKDANFAKTTGFSDDYNVDGSMSWLVANQWAENLLIAGVSGWRLPKLSPVNGVNFNFTYSTKGDSDNGYNISVWRSPYVGSLNNELAYLYYNTLANDGFKNLPGASVGAGLRIINKGPFLNIDSGYYWTSTESTHDITQAGAFSFGGQQSWGNKEFYFRAWAVHDGDVANLLP